MKTGDRLSSVTACSLLTALFVCGAVFTAAAENASFSDKSLLSSAANTGFFFSFSAVFVCVFALSLIRGADAVRRSLLLISYCAYAVICMTLTDDAFFCLGACLILLPICVFVCGGAGLPAVGRRFLTAVCAAAFIYFAVFFSIQTVCRYLTLSTPCFDFGIFSQMFRSMSKTGLPYTTCERETMLSHFAVHVSPVYYVFLPVYMVFPSPVTLQIMQALTLASGVIPVCLICRRRGLSYAASAAFVLLYVLYPALGGGTYYDVHENKFLSPLLLWMFYFSESGKLPFSALFALLVCLVKEDAPVYVIFAALYYMISAADKREKAAYAGIGGGAMLYFFTVLTLLSKYGDGVMTYRYSNFMAKGDTSLLSVVLNVIKAPAFAVYEIFNVQGKTPDVSKLVFILQTVLPTGALPFFIKRYERMILICPFVLVNLMPDYVYQHDVFFQYTYGSFAFLLFAAILNFSGLSERTKKVTAVFALCAATFFCTQTVWRRATYLKAYLSDKQTYDEIRTELESIPEDASVSATSLFCAAASGRRELYSLNNSKNAHKTDYAAIDLRWSSYAKYREAYDKDPEYEIVYEKEGRAVIYRLKAPAG